MKTHPKALTTCALLALLAGTPANAQEAEWIWHTPQAAADQASYLVRGFAIERPVASARVVATCDNHLTLFVNGREVARSDAWERPVSADVTALLTEGRNSLAADCRNDGGIAAFALRLDITYTDGTRERIVSSPDWRAAGEPVAGWNDPGFNFRAWGRAVSLGSTADASLAWGGVMTVREATPAERVEMPEGFHAELVRSSQSGEGSWVCLTIDPDGNPVVSPESGGIYRIVRTGPGASEFLPVNTEIGMCQGLLFTGGALYASVNENADRDGGLHRLRDADGDGVYEEREVLVRYPAKGEHGPHGLALGPDGMIYTVHGNHVPLVEKTDFDNSPFRNWAEDEVLPRIWDPRGHAVGIKAPGGTVYRFDPDGDNWQLVAGGLRNSYDIAFAPNGDLFTYDSDMEWDIGLPWYRPPRVVHLVEGGEYGWRSGTGKRPDWYADTLPPVTDTDLSSPVGVAFATPGNFPEPWASALFIADWAYGRIAAVHLEPGGASYTGRYDTFVIGLPLSVTDLEFDSDGVMWFTTGGRGTQSGLYRVEYRGDEPAATSHALGSLTPEAQLRRRLESLDGGRDEAREAAAALAHDDRFVRFAARLALERAGGVPSVSDLDAVPTLAVLLARDSTLGRSLGLAALLALADPSAGDPDPALLRALEIAISRADKDPASGAQVAARFANDFPTGDPRRDHILAELLAAVDAPGVGPKLLSLVETSTAREEQIHAALCLRVVAHQLSRDELARYLAWLQTAKGVSGGMSFRGYIEAIEREALELLDEDTRAWAASRIAEAPAPAEPPARPFVRAWDMASALEALDRREGSAERGRALFAATRCIECHRFDGAGGATGPDLTGVARRFSRRDLLEAVIEPSKVVSDQYRASVIRLNDGRELVGRLLQITGGRMHVLTNPYTHDYVAITQGDIAGMEDSPVSPMPPALINSLSATELQDLVAYLESGSRP